ncbi:hypothetical protein V6N11_000382 [Hibiscus sabdariffa]|uniref:Uncharacterized protein n=2 Tax=Hibiscus sabdariffa TaxID=183260 RepID=A0ABR2DA26_9ROSI
MIENPGDVDHVSFRSLGGQPLEGPELGVVLSTPGGLSTSTTMMDKSGSVAVWNGRIRSVGMKGDSPSLDAHVAMEVENVFGALDGCGVAEALPMAMADKRKETYASMAAKVSGAHDSLLGGGADDKDNVVVSVEEFVIDHYGPFPTLKFSECVQDQIDRNMCSTVIAITWA